MKSEKAKQLALESYLVAAAKTGDRTALSELVSLVSPRLLAHAGRLLGEKEAAQDITQSAWVDILRGLPSLREVVAFRSFALQIVTRKVAAEIARRQKGRALANDFAADAISTSEPLGELAADAATVRTAIDALPPDQRAALALFYVDDMSVAEVAIALDVPKGTVKTRLMHARAKLATILKGTADE